MMNGELLNLAQGLWPLIYTDPDKVVIDGKLERLGTNGHRAELANLLV